MKNKTIKPFEIIYITAIVTPTTVDGDILTLLALDDYSEFLHPPMASPINISDNELNSSKLPSINIMQPKTTPN